MKIAVCFSGLTRQHREIPGSPTQSKENTWRIYVETWQDRIIKPYNADVFVHSWFNTTAFGNGDSSFGYHYESDAHPEMFTGIHNFKMGELTDASMVIEDIRRQASLFTGYQSYVTKQEKYTYLQRLKQEAFASQYFSLKKSVELVEQFCQKENTNYDVIIKARWDVAPLGNIERCLTEPNKFWVDITGFPYGLDYRQYNLTNITDVPVIGDMMIISSFENMKIYKNLYENVTDILKTSLGSERPDIALNPHERAYEHLRQHNLTEKIDYHPLTFFFNKKEEVAWFYEHPEYMRTYAMYYEPYRQFLN